MPSLAIPEQGSSSATHGTKNLLTPEIGSDRTGKQSSLASHIIISGSASCGTKPGIGNQVYFSVGTAGDYKSGSPYITIISGIATFSERQENAYVGAGDKVSWSGGYCYLKRKLSNSSWMVIDELGLNPSDLGAISVTTISKVFNTLAAAIDGASPGLNSLIGSYDLRSLDIQPNILCYNMDDTTGVDVQDLWTVDASRYINIYAPYDYAYECNQPQRHYGKWGYGYKIEVSSGDALKIQQDRVYVNGLQLKSTAQYGLYLLDNSWSIIMNNIIKECGSDGIRDNNTTRSEAKTYFINNKIYDCTGAGIHYGNDATTAAEKWAFMYSNRLVANASGIKIRNKDLGITYAVWLKNNDCQNNTLDYDANNP